MITEDQIFLLKSINDFSIKEVTNESSYRIDLDELERQKMTESSRDAKLVGVPRKNLTLTTKGMEFLIDKEHVEFSTNSYEKALKSVVDNNAIGVDQIHLNLLASYGLIELGDYYSTYRVNDDAYTALSRLGS